MVAAPFGFERARERREAMLFLHGQLHLQHGSFIERISASLDEHDATQADDAVAVEMHAHVAAMSTPISNGLEVYVRQCYSALRIAFAHARTRSAAPLG